MQAPLPSAQPFSWLSEAFVPAPFTVLGAILGFAVGEIRDEWKAKRALVTFARAIGFELDALSDQLDASFYEVQGSIERLTKDHTGPQFAVGLRKIVFTTQLEKLRDVNDPLMLKIVHFYSDLGILEYVWRLVNEMSVELNRANAEQRTGARTRLHSGFTSLKGQISSSFAHVVLNM